MDGGLWTIHRGGLRNELKGISPWSAAWCQDSNSIGGFCTGALPKSPKDTRWAGLANWLTLGLGTRGTEVWQNIKSSWSQKSVDGQEGYNSTSWKTFLAKIFEEMITQAKQVGNGHANQLNIWDEADWSNALGRNHQVAKDIITTPTGQSFIGVLACIVLGLLRVGGSEEDSSGKYPGVCGRVVNEMRISIGDWNSWNEDNTRGLQYPAGKKCGFNQIQSNCPEARFALLLSVVEALMKVCPQCGPYNLNYWFKRPPNQATKQRTSYCQIDAGMLKCSSEIPSSDNPAKRITVTQYSYYQPLPHAPTPKANTETSKADNSMVTSQQTNGLLPTAGDTQVLVLLEQSPEEPASQGREEEQVHANNGTHKAIDISLASSGGSDQEHGVDPHQGETAQIPGPPEQPSPSGASRHGNMPQEMSQGDVVKQSEPGGISESSIRKSEGAADSGMRGSMGGILGGFFGTVILGAIGSYGLWRIYGRKGPNLGGQGLRPGGRISYKVL
ncbi:hypothetical protein C922_05544 [Plasmodium inui San Antonio 1]|uniref:Uncharacterized protein n=1 Tax=Plasmodium inui San Antonio 1 TaxID=1237626 RepID=W7AFL2_9APIC|nr:hypothetical protein C922_05544 [Plasmodium inui San Antonio 1]EUD64071.1 hypothetical protein C922_05544 [Plasmodium inui San Antonio 1]